MFLSVRGIARRYRGRTGSISVRRDVFPLFAPAGSLRQRLVGLARQQVSFNVSECIYGWTASYEQTWSLIRVRIRLNPDSTVTAATMDTLRTRWRDGIQQTWSDRWALGRSGEFTCPIRVEVQWVTSGQHHTVRVRPGPERSNVSTWDTEDTGGVAAHEFGHMLGHPDEYADQNCPARSPVSTGTVMDNNSSTVPARLMNRFATAIGSNVVAVP
jgi:hypothetical protein